MIRTRTEVIVHYQHTNSLYWSPYIFYSASWENFLKYQDNFFTDHLVNSHNLSIWFTLIHPRRPRGSLLRPNFFLARLDFSLPPLTAPGSPRMTLILLGEIRNWSLLRSPFTTNEVCILNLSCYLTHNETLINTLVFKYNLL